MALNRVLFIIEKCDAFDELFTFFSDSAILLNIIDRDVFAIDFQKEEKENLSNIEKGDLGWLNDRKITFILNL
jgi:hypothetical protein